MVIQTGKYTVIINGGDEKIEGGTKVFEDRKSAEDFIISYIQERI